MKFLILTATALSLLGGAAFAQENAAPPPPPPPGADAGPDASAPPPPPPPGKGPKEMRGGPGGPRGDRMGPPPPPPSRAGHIRLELGEKRGLDVKCADDEPMKVCADIANALLDRIAPPRP